MITMTSNFAGMGLLALGMLSVAGCTHKSVKPVDAPAAAAPASAVVPNDQQRFKEVMDMLYKLKGESPPGGAEAAAGAAK